MDAEQQYLSSCYYYSSLLGYNVDTMSNPELYKTICDWIGVTYHYSGDSKNGIDCSRFTAAIYREAYNRILQGSSADLFKKSKVVPKSELKEGDLVFFKTRKKRRVSHVGIYLSHNKFIHASVHEGVVVSDLNEPYYRKHFYKAGEIIKG